MANMTWKAHGPYGCRVSCSKRNIFTNKFNAALHKDWDIFADDLMLCYPCSTMMSLSTNVKDCSKAWEYQMTGPNGATPNILRSTMALEPTMQKMHSYRLAWSRPLEYKMLYRDIKTGIQTYKHFKDHLDLNTL